MADLLSIVGAVAVAIHSLRKTKGFVESIKGAPEVVKRLFNDLKAIERPLQDLSSLAEDALNFDYSTRNEVAQCLHPALSSCQQTSDNITDCLRPFIKPGGMPNRSVWKRLAFGFKENKLMELRKQLALY